MGENTKGRLTFWKKSNIIDKQGIPAPIRYVFLIYYFNFYGGKNYGKQKDFEKSY
jgi:hypothetical protein